MKTAVMGLIYFREGKRYVKIQRNEVIRQGAMHSWCNGELIPLANPQETIGQTPNDFSPERDFYNPVD